MNDEVIFQRIDWSVGGHLICIDPQCYISCYIFRDKIEVKVKFLKYTIAQLQVDYTSYSSVVSIHWRISDLL